jgi:UTP--glucose-1-phosphate uridylyltransferase
MANEHHKVRKAVIAAAGMGTRFLPQTKAMPKEMLPIIDKPVIQLVVENVVAAGVEDIVIVTGPTKRAIEDHFDRSLELEDELREKGKNAMADELKNIAELANFIYVRQKGTPKGNARPILNASHMIGDEPFFFFFADDFFTGEQTTAQQLLESYDRFNGPVVALREVNDESIQQYGVARIKGHVDEHTVRVTGIVEKPAFADAPSTYAVATGYLLTPDIIPILEQEIVGPDGEIRISDAIELLAKQRTVYGRIVQGEYHDTGSPERYIETLIDISLKDPKTAEHVRAYLRDRL